MGEIKLIDFLGGHHYLDRESLRYLQRGIESLDSLNDKYASLYETMVNWRGNFDAQIAALLQDKMHFMDRANACEDRLRSMEEKMRNMEIMMKGLADSVALLINIEQKRR